MADQPQNTNNPNPGGPYEGMEIPDLGRVLEQQRQFNISGSEGRAIMEEMRDYMKQIAEFQSMSAGKQSRINRLTSDATKLAAELASFDKKSIKSASARQKFIDKYNQALDFQSLLEVEISELLEDETEKREELARILGDILGTSKEVSSEAEKLTKKLEKANKVTEKFQYFENIIKDIPIVSKMFSQLTKGSKAFSDNFAKTGSIFQARLAGVGATAKGLFDLTLGALVTGLIRGFTKLDQSVAALQNGLALSQQSASKLASTISKFKGDAFTLAEMEKAAIGFGSALGSSSVAAGSTIKRVALLSERLGISAEESARIYSNSNDALMSFERQTDIIAGTVDLLNQQTGAGIRLTDVLRDVSNASADTAVSLGKFPNGLAKAAFEARKLGLTLAEIKGVQGSLLDFASSITAELEAEAQLGEDFNLDRARYYANTNDIVNLSKELYNITGGLAKFQKMSFLDQQAMAKMVGMTTDQYADMLRRRESLLKLAKDEQIVGFDMLTQEQQIEALVKKYTGKDFNLSVEDARIKALEALQLTEQAQGAKTLKAQENALDAMKKLSISLENLGIKLAEAFTEFTGLQNLITELGTAIQSLTTKLGEWIEKITTKIDTLPNLIQKTETKGQGLFAGGTALKKASEIGVKALEKTSKTGLLAKGATFISKGALKFLGKGLGKLLPGAGLLLAIKDFMDGDMLGGFTNLVAGIASFFPGIGTGIAAALSAFDLAREGYNLATMPKVDQDKTKQAEEASNPKDFIIKTYPEDAIKFKGGTLLGDSVRDSVESMIKSVNPIDENGLSRALESVTINAKAPLTNQNITQQPVVQTVDNTETNKLLQVLVDTVKKGGNIYLDRRKVGESLVLGYSSQ